MKVEFEIRDDGSLGGANVTQVATPAGEGEIEVRGTVSALVPATATLAGSVTVTVRSLPVTCAIPAGMVLTVEVGGFAELECRLVGDPAVWTVRAAKAEDVQGPDDDVDEVEVRGTIAAPFAQTASIVTVTPLEGGVPVSCTIPPGSLSQFAAGDAVKVECVTVGGILKLKEIERPGDRSGHGDDHDGGHGGGDSSGHGATRTATAGPVTTTRSATDAP